MKKRFLSILLSLCMVLTLVPATVFAADTTVGENEAYVEEPEQTAVEQVQAMLDALPTVEELENADEATVNAAYEAAQDAFDALEALSPEELETIIGMEKLISLMDWFNGQVSMLVEGEYLDVGNAKFEGVTSTTTVNFGSGSATFDPKTKTLTLNNVTITANTAESAAINSNISGLKIVLNGENKITLSNDTMAALYLLGNTTISGSGSLVIESTGKRNKGITTTAPLTISGPSISITDKALTKGYMLGIYSGGNLSMTSVNYTATDVLCAIDLDEGYTSTLTNVAFNVRCTPTSSFTIDDPTTMAVGIHTLDGSGKNTITGCSGSITAQFPLYIDGPTELKNSSNLTLTTDNYYAVNLNDTLTVSGGTLNLSSTGSGADGFRLRGTSKLVVTDSANVTVNVDRVAISLSVASGSMEMKSGTVTTTAYAGLVLGNSNAQFTLTGGTLNMNPKAGVAAVGIQNYGTVTVSGGSLNTTGMSYAIQNLGGKTVSFSGGTHTLGVSDTGTCYFDKIDGVVSTLSVGNTANVTFTGGKSNTISGKLNVTGGTLNFRDMKDWGIILTGTLNQSGGILNVSNTYTYGVYVAGALNLTGGTMNVRDIQKNDENTPGAIVVCKDLNLTGGTLNTSGTTVGMFVYDGVATNFSGTNATIAGTATGWYGIGSSSSYSVTGGKVVFQGGSNGAANAKYTTLGDKHKVYAGSSESDAEYVPSPTAETFKGNTYVVFKSTRSFTLTLESVYLNDYGLDLPGGSSPTTYTHTEGSNISYTATDVLEGFHFDHWELKVGSNAATNVGTSATYTGTMPSDNATLKAVYVYCSGGTATCTSLPKCSTCDKEYGVLAAHKFTAEVEDAKYLVTAPTCEDEGKYYKSCGVCGASSKDWSNATFTVPALPHTDSAWKSDADGHWKECTVCSTVTTAKVSHTPNIAAPNETEAQVCTVCEYVMAAAISHTHNLTKVEAKAPTCVADGIKEHYSCSCGKLFTDATGSTETTAEAVIDKATGKHDYEWIIDKAATATEKGSKHEECKACHDKKPAVDIPATGTVGTIDELQALINAGGTVTLQKDYDIASTLNVSNTVILDLNGHTIRMTGSGSVIAVNSGANLTLKDSSSAKTGTITGGKASWGGGVYNSGTFKMAGGSIVGCKASRSGGGVMNYGTFIMQSGNIAGCTAQWGGGVMNNGTATLSGSITDCKASNTGGGVQIDGGNLTLQNGKIEDCTAPNGGGVYNKSTFVLKSGNITDCTATESGGGVYNNSIFTMEDGNITDCTAAGNGGGVYNKSTFTMKNGEIADCTALNGGGVFNQNKFTLEDGTISDCKATSSGGGVYNSAGTFTMKGGTISGCEALASEGGGVYNNCAVFTMEDGTISGCKATYGGGGVSIYSVFFVMKKGTISGCKATYGGGAVHLNSVTIKEDVIYADGGSIIGDVYCDSRITRSDDATDYTTFTGTVSATDIDPKACPYTVTFDSNGGSAVATQYVLKGQAPKTVANPTKEHFDFVRWHTEASKTAYDFSAVLTQSVALFADWSCAQHSGGTATCKDQAVCEHCGKPYGEVDSNNHDLENIKENAANVTETGNIEYWHCKDCDNNFSDESGKTAIDLKDTVTPKLPPEIIDGKGQSLTAGEKKELTFRSNAAYSDFICVEVDGKTVDENNYTVKEGSTIVTLKADYVATLSVGEHTLGIVSESGTATTTFTVNAKVVNDTTAPQTGDNSHMALWLALILVSGGALIGTAVYGKKRKRSAK